MSTKKEIVEFLKKYPNSSAYELEKLARKEGIKTIKGKKLTRALIYNYRSKFDIVKYSTKKDYSDQEVMDEVQNDGISDLTVRVAAVEGTLQRVGEIRNQDISKAVGKVNNYVERQMKRVNILETGFNLLDDRIERFINEVRFGTVLNLIYITLNAAAIIYIFWSK